MKRLLKGGRVIDPANGIDGVQDVLIDGDRIARVGADLPVDGAVVVEIPAGLIVCPGLIDMHVHLREPGQEHKETVATGTASAVAGGFTAVACMPNTSPVNDNANVTGYILTKAAEANLARVYPIGAVSRKSEGELLADIAELRDAGCVAITDDGRPVATALLLRRAMEYAGMFGMPVIEHCEDASLKGDAVAHEGYHAAVLGLRGMPGACEALGVERGILLSELTGSGFHVAHMSARASLRAVRKGKDASIRVTCEVAPHHFTLTDESLGSPIPYDTNVKMNPPLREAADRDAMLAGIADGSVDAIATDHAPHHYDEKKVEFDRAPFGIVGLETAVPLAMDRLVHRGVIRLSRLVELLSVNPARILRVPGGTLAPGAPADITILAPDLKVRVDAGSLRSEIEEHTVRRVGAARRGRRDDRRRPNLLRQSGGARSRMSRQEDIREKALQDLQAYQVLMLNGHFDFGNGFHGSLYLNPHQLLRYPSTIWRFAQDLIDILPSTILEATEVVAGPVTGGALLGHTIAGLLDSRRAITGPPTLFAPFTRASESASRRESGRPELEPKGGFTLMRFYERLVSGKRALVVDDVRNTGLTQVRCVELLRKAGATVLATAEIYDRMEAMFDAGVPNFALADKKAPPNFAATDCPLCREAIAVTRF